MEQKILIIEDEVDIREAMADAITNAGYHVDTAINGALGLEKAIETRPDLILLDLNMPEMDGHAVLQKLRSHPWGNTVRVVILSANDDAANIVHAHKGDIIDYIIKSNMDLSEVVNKVRQALHVEM